MLFTIKTGMSLIVAECLFVKYMTVGKREGSFGKGEGQDSWF